MTAERRPDTAELLPLDQYDLVIVGYSGGKDSLACVLDLLDRGVPREKIELWHQDVDGRGEALMDWPCTPAYVRATGEALDIPVVFSWRHGGFVKEMLRNNESTAPVSYEREGVLVTLPTTRERPGTRRKFPQMSADLSVRWCSPYLKIDVAARVIANDPRLAGLTILYITGERRQESTARSRYATVEEHRTHNSRRTVHQWRSILDWSEEQVWEIIRRWNILPHPAYLLGWGRTSCAACIFGDKDQWASFRELLPDRFARIAAYEQEFGLTIKQGESVEDQADRGTPFVDDKPDEYRELALDPEAFTADHFFLPPGESWQLPAGAYKRCGGPI